MVTPDATAIAREIIDEESCGLVRYVVEYSRPPIVGGRDADALSLFHDLYRESEIGLTALIELVDAAGRNVLREPHWPLEYTSFHFLRPIYLLRPVAEQAERALGRIDELARQLEAIGWPEAVACVRSFVAAERPHLASVRRLAGELGEIRADAPRRKGTSASRW